MGFRNRRYESDFDREWRRSGQFFNFVAILFVIAFVGVGSFIGYNLYQYNKLQRECFASRDINSFACRATAPVRSDVTIREDQ
jgi:hypothetical protein